MIPFSISRDTNVQLRRWHRILAIKNFDAANFKFGVVIMPFPLIPDYLVRAKASGHVKTKALGDLARNWSNTVKFAIGLLDSSYNNWMFACEGVLPHYNLDKSVVGAVKPNRDHNHNGVKCCAQHVRVQTVSNMDGVTRVSLIPRNVFSPMVSTF